MIVITQEGHEIMLLFFTIVAVSLDAFIASLAYNIKNKLSVWEITYCSSFTFLLCCLTLTVSAVLQAYGNVFKIAGGIIFICLGCKSFLPSGDEQRLLKKRSYFDLAVLGLGVAADAALACLTMTAGGWLIPLYAFYMFAAHFFFICLGMVTAGSFPVLNKLSFLSGLFLIALGFYKIFG